MIDSSSRHPPSGFRHEAVLYHGADEFLDGTLQFVRDGFEAGEPILVAVSRPKIRALRAELDGEGERLYFADMEAIGRNPACIIPAWSRFVEDHGAGARPLRGVGEPVWAERTPAELAECHLHEALLNIAFAEAPSFWLRCPYDTERLDATTIEHARHSHPLVVRDGVPVLARDTHDPFAALDLALPPPPPARADLSFSSEDDMGAVRDLVSGQAYAAGLGIAVTTDLVLAVHEIATNSLRHGGGGGRVRVWRDDDELVCEVCDAGHISDPLAGRRRPTADATNGRGLWIANRLADLVQVRSTVAGTIVRVHVRAS